MIVERHLGGHVLVGVVTAVEHDLGLGLVDADVVGDLDRPDVAALVALADREARGRWPGGRRPRRRPRRSPRCSCGSPVRPAGNSVAVATDAVSRIRRAARSGATARVRRPEAESHRVQHDRAGRKRHRPEGPSDAGARRPGRAPGPGYASRDDRPRRRPGHDRHAGARTTRRPWSSVRPASSPGRGEAGHRFRWASVTKLATALARPDRRRPRPARSRRGGRSAGLDRPPSARPRLGAAVRGPGEPRARPGRGGSTRTRGSMPSGSWWGSGTAGRSRRSSANGSSAPLGMDRHAPGGAAVAGSARTDRRPRRARGGAAPADAGRAGDGPGGDHGRVPGSRRRRARRRAGSTRATGASGPNCTTARRRTGWATRNSPATFGHFGGAGTFLWVDPVARARARRADRPRVRSVGARGVAAVLGCGARRRRRAALACRGGSNGDRSGHPPTGSGPRQLVPGRDRRRGDDRRRRRAVVLGRSAARTGGHGPLARRRPGGAC